MPQYLAAPSLISQSDLVWIAPESLAIELCKHYDLITRPLPLAMEEYEIGIYWHDRFHKDPANMWLREKVATCIDPATIVQGNRSYRVADAR
jgi:DNA-binding transcriptional LysR family regulator